ncbi:uracil phosphoribosyltransferase-domain-containing protein [Mycena belliarum]|uniref:Uracil phosphoribosyltransferase-domain-containing protein n=1 Tax=Mycena belliarum TaxID=1033014 RepID=A0AAD6TW28_9AGAR|nr:uracil phosphoribosyltransferase-domain-containing protein [Mycena belliae]
MLNENSILNPWPTATPQGLGIPAPARSKAPTIIGLYGPPGCGKSYQLGQLKAATELGEEEFAFYEGSAVLDLLIPGGLEAFKRMNPADKTRCREKAISHIGAECAASGKLGLVAGHFMFWEDETEEAGDRVWNGRDAAVFTHIIYLAVPPEDVVQRRATDPHRRRAAVSKEHVRRWQEAEREALRAICLAEKIIFTVAPTGAVPSLIREIQHRTEGANLLHAHNALDEVVAGFRADGMRRGAMLVFDADRTLIAQDTGKVFWEIAMADSGWDTVGLGAAGRGDPMKLLFSSPFGYSYGAFLQAAFIYGVLDASKFDTYCAQTAAAVSIHPEIVSLLQSAAERRVGTVIVTCGLRTLWEKIVHAAGLSQTVKVIGGGRVDDEDAIVITARVKRELVKRLQDEHEIHVCAFGDSSLDLPMLEEADKAVVVVGEEHTRSRSMDAALENAIVNDGLRAEQWLLPRSAAPRLDTDRLPLFDISASWIDSVVRRFALYHRVLHATEEYAAKLLMTPMRDAQVSGPALLEAHKNVGWYLATTFLPKLMGGLEEVTIRHVQGHSTTGHRLRHEERTVIVALMRGGEPMALGVYKALPLAMFVHAKQPGELTHEHVRGRETIVLVDSVVNSGKSIDEFVAHIRALHPTVRIVVVAGVVQAQSLLDGVLGDALARDDNIGVVSLRLSENKYTGRGATDTGHRLFNTTHLD